jgi:hypothetical protein
MAPLAAARNQFQVARPCRIAAWRGNAPQDPYMLSESPDFAQFASARVLADIECANSEPRLSPFYGGNGRSRNHAVIWWGAEPEK